MSSRYDPDMPHYRSTCWQLIDEAAIGGVEPRNEFARRYQTLVRKCLADRWRGCPLLAELDDAVQEVFMECFRSNGVLDRAELQNGPGFRAFLGGVIRNVARRCEETSMKQREGRLDTTLAEQLQPVRQRSISELLDQGWVVMILDGARKRFRNRALLDTEQGARRVELLRLRFEDGLPIREIAKQWASPAEQVHTLYRRARREFHTSLREEILTHAGNADDARRLWKEFLALL